MQTIDLNADLGEGGDQDTSIIELVSSVNIACGGHAGDKETIRRTVDLALKAQVAIGAHPGYEDPENFGRNPMQLSSEEIRSLILRQLERMLLIHPNLHHVKPHGALYNQANQDESIAAALVAAIAELQPKTILYCPPQGELANAAAVIKLTTCAEGFIDRRYQDDGNLCPRSEPGAVIEYANKAALQALKIANQEVVNTINGTTIPLKVRTLCVHGDSANSLITLKLTRSALEDAGIRISAP
ncbi:MAG: 5-oxoprolinase subunit PxpA [Akkermansiaceae bacterium]|jgi:5-oxoprolinase (ATP-hydrolysing) subunit A|nr:5-oxoprolinase subunit PxpA [Akkermansiaceae bacterium]MDP4646611.1 5-oxoprolinase subunit PxpA [Akkermansiaceae bacterium]MDP4720190.1 5-oxoprolinase subunit PxpA [Akkermansiaceae bacterium]MDP4779820.1 5-oxoprolinase subunit PxpA [Akkermansiaceae bacterium]MDP4846393.1 5-oxoprolinase subunit PxpA [Akkermansiaceae bacterium]